MADEKQKVVDLKKRVDVIATAKHPVYAKGTKFSIGVLMVDHLAKKGFIEKSK